MLLTIFSGFLIGLVAAYFLTRRIYDAGRACGYLEGRLFLTRRRVLMRTPVWVNGQPIDDACCVWIETNAFTADERRPIDAVEQLRTELNESAVCANHPTN